MAGGDVLILILETDKEATVGATCDVTVGDGKINRDKLIPIWRAAFKCSTF